MTRTHYIILAVFFALLFAGCASIDVETKYGNVAFDGKTNRYSLKIK